MSATGDEIERVQCVPSMPSGKDNLSQSPHHIPDQRKQRVIEPSYVCCEVTAD